METKRAEATGGPIGRYPSLAMVYAPYQVFGGLYDPATALMHGTLFRELDKPFLAAKNGGCPR